ncbi:hypothetical protein A4X09_0g3371 [Tilletia walkeri]|uniref:RCC1/BLIP-II n=1 Tax=Tilletia walkeri TaxID=117179 RepID=A0A8X7N878_9BASI|nr:hypothetical protein A4X09_0g3371 [Tilletia walkeri]
MSQRFFLLTAGSNARGQLGIGHDQDAFQWTLAMGQTDSGSETCDEFPPAGTRVVDLKGGANHTVALVEDLKSGERTLWGTGDTSQGQLGPQLRANGEAVSRFTQIFDLPEVFERSGGGARPRVKQIAAAWESTYLAFAGSSEDDDTLVSLGSSNDFGQLGVEDADRAGNDVHTVKLRQSLEGSECVGDTRRLGRIEIIKLSAGVRHACAVIRTEVVPSPEEPSRSLDSKDTMGRCMTFLLGWGAARHGQLDAILNSNASTSSKPPRAFRTARVMGAWDGSVDVDVRCGRDHTVVIVSSSKSEKDSSPERDLITLGSNRQSQSPFRPMLSPRQNVAPVQAVATMWNTTLTLLQAGTEQRIDVWGAASRGQAGSNLTASATVENHPVDISNVLGNGTGRVVDLVAGSEHGLLLLETISSERSNREVWGWGWTEHGNLPSSHTPDPKDPRQVIIVPERIWPAPVLSPSIPVNGDVDKLWAGCATTFLQIAIPTR